MCDTSLSVYCNEKVQRPKVVLWLGGQHGEMDLDLSPCLWVSASPAVSWIQEDI